MKHSLTEYEVGKLARDFEVEDCSSYTKFQETAQDSEVGLGEDSDLKLSRSCKSMSMLVKDIRSQDGKDDKDNDKGSMSRLQSMKEQDYNEDKDQENSQDIFSFGSALEDFICVVFVPDRNIVSNSVCPHIGGRLLALKYGD
ncbi:hypothetical protein Tco_0815740 [Tanacetum coccineum]